MKRRVFVLVMAAAIPGARLLKPPVIKKRGYVNVERSPDRVKVFLNGKLIPDVVAADDIRGCVIRRAREANGEPKVDRGWKVWERIDGDVSFG